ncbi:MAG: 50S ribosomal protein L4, partial [Gammaproteobacteria bacterium]|nr:50S ribosomal protein L4 [Gammaproteobacteria bacterium]
MELSLANDGGSIELAEGTFGRVFNEALVHQVVVAYMAAGRSGTHAQKTRAEVRGGGRKPYRQKGTGRSRAGSTRSPLRRGGGRTFPAKPRSHAQKVNRKMYRGAMRCIFSELIRQNRLLLTSEFSVDSPRTQALAAKLATLELSPSHGKVLIVATSVDENLYLAARNLRGVGLRAVPALGPGGRGYHPQVRLSVEESRA